MPLDILFLPQVCKAIDGFSESLALAMEIRYVAYDRNAANFRVSGIAN